MSYDKIYGSLLGMAMGDSAGFAAMYHRALVLPPKRRNRLWSFSQITDRHRINKISLPFTHAMSEEILDFCGTDDTEFSIVAAQIILDCGNEITEEKLLHGWMQYIVKTEQEIWSGVSERASIENIKKGILPPAAGNDNPHHYDDGSVSRAVPIGLIYRNKPEKAAGTAKKMASITNAEDGVYAAQAMAASIAVALSGASPQEIVKEGLKYVPENTWIRRKIEIALNVLEETKGDGFAAIPLWQKRVVNAVYNYANIAPETLAVAYAIFLSTEGDLQKGIQLASLLPKQSDSMPAMVGALSGALQGANAVPETWKEALDEIKGICIPSLQGTRLKDIAAKLASLENV
ncbi:ADP-ribosylglycohydrolase family protein [Cytobacillus firmus]|uniref:ADP-ribosylglycohydrolase family protein n=1 Tax=Cytobacillus firmus TaxID=1399 RepID=UPI001CFC6A65|nr:ADP-ribosylglycohydrolase family protein [Cytobacillus firmus]